MKVQNTIQLNGILATNPKSLPGSNDSEMITFSMSSTSDSDNKALQRFECLATGTIAQRASAYLEKGDKV